MRVFIMFFFLSCFNRDVYFSALLTEFSANHENLYLSANLGPTRR